MTSDTGVVLVPEFDAQRGPTADVFRRMVDGRDARYVTHELATLVPAAPVSNRGRAWRCE